MSVKWGIVGTGRICCDFILSLQQTEGAEIVAVGSRTQARLCGDGGASQCLCDDGTAGQH